MTEDRPERPSFDPRSWVPPAPATAATGGRGTPIESAPSPEPAKSRRLPLAFAGSAAILLLGGIAAHLSRPAPGSPQAIAAKATAEVRRREVHRTLVLSGPQDLLGALTANGVAAQPAAQAVAAAGDALKPGGEIRAAMTLERGAGGALRLLRLDASNADSSGVAIIAGADGRFVARPVAANLSTQVIVRRGVMDADSFYTSAVAAGVTDSLIPDFARALAFDFDFQREVHRGDVFEAAFEQPVDPQGQPVGAPRLLYAALQTTDKSAAVYRFRPPGEEEGWFDGSGRSVVRALLRTPVDAARVSSGFGFRIHPVLGFMKMHKGIDFAAPIGTPIYASGTGTVELATPSATAGNWLKLRHDNGWETVYMHMNRYMPGIVAGAHVMQGQQVGEIGTTGRSTGPHLHYELHIKDEPVDPAGVEMESSKTLSGPALEAFTKERDRIDVNRARAAG